MKIYGYFSSKKGDTYKVEMDISGASGQDMEIEPGGVLQFADEDIVTIESGANDSLDVVQQHSATIALQASQYVSAFFTKEYKDGKVKVSRITGGYGSGRESSACVFSGWLEPRTLSQPFNDVYDDVSLSCVDCLSAMQYSPFRGVGVSRSYNSAAANSKVSTFKELLQECLEAGCGSLDGYTVYYDGSKKTSDDGDVFDGLSVNDMVFLGDDEDSVDTCQEVLESILKYLNLHIVQYGTDFYIYSWESIRKGSAEWTALSFSGTGNGSSASKQTGGLTVISQDNVEDTDAQIDVTEIFNQVALSVSPKKQSSALVSPLDNSGRVPAMGPRRPYVSEFAADGEGERALRSFYMLAVSGSSNVKNYDATRTYKDYYVRVMRNVHWKIGSKGTDWAEEQSEKDAEAPNDVVTRLSTDMGALLLSVGSVDHKPDGKDNSAQTSIGMEDWLVVSVNGNGDNNSPKPSESDLEDAAPVATYTGGTEGASYSPVDKDATNYLVIEGSLVLNPIMKMSETISDMEKEGGTGNISERSYNFAAAHTGHTVDSRTHDDGRYLTFGWWKPWSGAAGIEGISPFQDTTNATSYAMIGTREVDKGWIPYTGDGPQEYEYKTKSGKDTISKVGVLECMMVIGTGKNAKVLVEDEGTDGSNDGAMSRFSWQPYKTLEECGNDKNIYYAQSFAIGIDPKMGDCIIGTEFDIATNFDYNTNISADKGMAIPLPHEAKLSGQIRFQILGPVNGYWDDNVKRHRTWFRREKWSTNSIPVLAHVSSIIVKSLSIKMYTGTEDSSDDGDVVYMSRVSHKFYNKKDGLEFPIYSGFTNSEISQFGLSDSILTGTVCGADGMPVLTIKDINTGNESKPEKLYVDAVYQELHAPRIILTQNMQDVDGSISPFSLYTHRALGRNFYVRDMGMNLCEGSAQLKLEECF